MPANFRFIQLIKIALPEAKLFMCIVIKGDMLVEFQTLLFINAHGFCYDLEDVVQYYKLYEDLMEFWRSEFPNSFYDLNYEELVINHEKETRSLIDYLGRF